MITLLDYGAGNLASLEGALEALGFPFRRAESPAEAPAEGLWVLPGDGHYGAAQRNLAARGWWSALKDRIASGGPLLGICVGLQLLAEGSEEAPGIEGLGVFPGLARRLGPGVKVPHMGWSWASPARKESGPGGWLYFVHSYALDPCGATEYSAEHGRPFTAAAAAGNVVGIQPHPEKSGPFGRALLARTMARLGESPEVAR